MKSMQKLTRDEMTTMVIASLYNLANAMSAVFMNVYLYAYTGSLVVMSVYTMVRIGLFPFFFTLAAQDQFAVAPQLVYVVAALTGVGEGLFWLSLNSLNQIVSSPQSRSRFLAGVGICNNISAIAAPLVSTLTIDTAVSDTAGYVEIFKLVLVIYALIALVSLRVKARSAPQPFSVLKRMKLDDPQWRYCMITTFFYGMHNSLSLTLA